MEIRKMFAWQHSSGRRIDEVDNFQPIFQIFLKGFLKKLNFAGCVESMNGINLSVELKFLDKENVNTSRNVVVTGSTDVVVHNESSYLEENNSDTRKQRLVLRSVLGELKSSHGQLTTATGIFRARDQLLCELMGVSATRKLAAFKSFLDDYVVTPVRGFLTDADSLMLQIMPSSEENTFLISSAFTEAEDYVLGLIFILLPMTELDLRLLKNHRCVHDILVDIEEMEDESVKESFESVPFPIIEHSEQIISNSESVAGCRNTKNCNKDTFHTVNNVFISQKIFRYDDIDRSEIFQDKLKYLRRFDSKFDSCFLNKENLERSGNRDAMSCFLDGRNSFEI